MRRSRPTAPGVFASCYGDWRRFFLPRLAGESGSSHRRDESVVGAIAGGSADGRTGDHRHTGGVLRGYRLYHTGMVLSHHLVYLRRRRRFRIGTRQRSWTRPVAWELIPMTALWAGEGGAQLSQHTAQVGRINWLDRYTCSPGHRAYCCAELAVSSLAMALTTASTHFAIPQRVRWGVT